MTTYRGESGESNGANPSASSVPHEEVNRLDVGVVNPLGQNVNPDSATAAVPLIRDGAPGAQGWMDGSGRFLLGPYTGHRMLDVALTYAQQGWYVFQIRMGTKGGYFANCSRCNPRSDSYDKEAHEGGTGNCTVHPGGYARCHGFHAATRNPDVIRQWWTENPHGNIGIDCGRSGIALIDVDIKHHLGKTGDQSIAALEAAHGPFPRGPRAITASGGWHWVFALPDDHELRSSTGYTDANGAKHGLADYVDIKAVGGLMVAAPSLVYDDKTGRVTGQYVWDPETEGAIPDLPRWVVAEIERREQRHQAKPTMSLSFGPRPDASADEVRAQVMKLADEVATTREGGRNKTLYDNAKKCFQYAEAGQIPHAEIEFIFEQAARAAGLDNSDMHTIRNARQYAQGKPRPWLASFGAAEARELHNVWKGIPAARTEQSAEPQEQEETTGDGAPADGAADPDTPQELPLNTYEERVDAFGINYPDYRTALAAVYDHKPDQMGISELFTRELKGGDHLRWNDEANKFYSYTEGHWNEDGEKHTAVSRKVDMLGKRVTLLVDNDIIDIKARIKGLTNGSVEPRGGLARDEEIKILEDTAKARPAWYKTYRSAGGRAGIVEFIKTAVDPVTGEQMDADPHLLNFANGTYDVRTEQLRGHEPKDYLTHRIDRALHLELASKPLEEVAPLFARILDRACAAEGEVSGEIKAQRVAAVKRGIGSIPHGANPEKKMLVLKGASNTGKTVVVNVLKVIMGHTLATEAKPTLLIRTRNERHESEEYKLKGRRLVLINELESKMSMDEGQVLRLINPSGSKFTVRKLREQQQDINMTWSVVVTTNELLKARVTPQVLNRLTLFPMSEVSVPDAEIDPTLFDRIMEQEADAILAHVVSWWQEWYRALRDNRTGLIVTDEMRAAVETFKDDNASSDQMFRDERTEAAPGGYVKASDIWSSFNLWLQSQRPETRREFEMGRTAFYKAVEGWDGVEAVYEHKAGRNPVRIGFKGLMLVLPTEKLTEMQARVDQPKL